MMFGSICNQKIRSFAVNICKGVLTILTMFFSTIQITHAAPPDAATKAMIDAAITNERTAPQRIRKLSTHEITPLLISGNFEEIELTISDIEKAAKKDRNLEFEFHATFIGIDSTNSNLLASLDKWVKSRPSPISYSARGIYLGGRAFHLRGARMAKETPALNFELMEMTAQEAIQDLNKAISLNPSFIPAYTELIKLSKLSRRVDAFQLVNTISQLQPGNMQPREAFLETLEPRWGGSHEAMFSFAESAARDAKHNPLLWLLTGSVYLELTRSRQQPNPEQDVKDLTEGLKYGESNKLLEARGDAYWRLKNYPAAIVDYTKCVENNPKGPHQCAKRLKSLTDWQERVRNAQQKSN